ncbi:MAG: molybdate ABC transporter substrate-binding protein [Burkholderiaceae bacterium]|nr:molybdate ABC transporter substrate-binding protein [Burkholderiaceae bacterium]
MTFKLLLALLASWLLSVAAQAAEVKVAVAANFALTMKDIAAEFEKDTGHKVSLTQGATGKFYAQITNGAPFEVLLSADDETPSKLVREGKAVSGTQFTYAVGRLVLWSPDASLVDQGGGVLKTDRFKFLSIANARVAPYGRAAVQTMQKLGVLTAIEPRVVQGESITQTHQFVSSGNAQLGFVALSQVWENGRIKSGSAWIVPEDMHEQLKQDAVLLNPGKDSKAAVALVDYLKSDKARKIIDRYGYKLQ